MTKGNRENVYDNAYDEILARICKQSPETNAVAMKALSWVLCAKRPLSPLELQHAIAVEDDEVNLDEDNITELETMVSACAGLLTVDHESETVRFVHYSTQEYLERRYRDQIAEFETAIYKTCLSYISFDNFQSGRCETIDELEERFELNPFYSYATVNWERHALSATCDIGNLDRFFRDVAKNDASCQAMEIFGNPGLMDPYELHTRKIPPEQMTGLHLAAYYGLERETTILKDQQNVDARTKEGYTPLALAVAAGYEVIVRILLNAGANIAAKDNKGRTIFMWALHGRNHQVLELLLKLNADIDLRDDDGSTALLLALEWDHDPKIIGSILESGADANIQNNQGSTALHYATEWSLEEIALLFLRGRAYVNIWNDEGAADDYSEEIVRMLLEKGASVNTESGTGRTALQFAAARNKQRIFEMILEKEANPSIQDHNGLTALHYAALHGNREIMKMLLNNNANPDPETRGLIDAENSSTALHIAVCNDDQEMAKMLLDSNANVNIQNNVGQTAMTIAIRKNNSNIASLLIEHNPLASVRDKWEEWFRDVWGSRGGDLGLFEPLFAKGEWCDDDDWQRH